MSITHPRGFRAAGVPVGLKASGGRDLALVVNDGPRDQVLQQLQRPRAVA